MKTHAQVVIIGGGSLGVNLMYHLTQELYQLIYY